MDAPGPNASQLYEHNGSRGQASADDIGEKRVERYSPDPERSPQAQTLAQDSPCMGTGAVDTDFTRIGSLQSGTGDALSSYGFATTSYSDWHCSWSRSPCVNPMSFNGGDQSLLNLHITSENSGLMVNAEDLSSGQEIHIPGRAGAPQFSVIPLMARTVSPHILSPANVEIPPGPGLYPVPIQALTGLTASARTWSMLRDNEESYGPLTGIEGCR
ncbi:uncharacterized protein FFNC_15415 [Fusarium fujikuroi]|nr:uncharacterized protein FFNC_15415 [Fusarium fujikuroi]